MRTTEENLGLSKSLLIHRPSKHMVEAAYVPPTIIETAEKHAIEFAKQNCLKTCQFMLETGAALYRGHKLGEATQEFFHVLGNMSGRVSANAANYYTLLMDNLPSWSDYPKRSQSFICSNEADRAEHYGFKTSALIPKDGTLIGKCSGQDIWVSFPALFKYRMDTMNDFDHFLNSMDILLLPAAHVSFSDQDWEKLKAGIDAMSRVLSVLKPKELQQLYDKEYPNGSYTGLFLFLQDALRKCGGDLLSFLDIVMGPEQNKFELGTFEAVLNAKNAFSREFWFSGEMLAIPIYALQDFLAAVVNNDIQAESSFVWGRYLTEGYIYQYAGDYNAASGAAGIAFDATTVGKLVDGAADITPEEFLLRANVSLADKLKIRKDENEYEYLFNRQFNVLILYDSMTARYQFFMPKE